MFKFEKKMLPEVFDDYFKKPAHQHNTRFAALKNNYAMVRITSAKEKSLLKYIAINVPEWDRVPEQDHNHSLVENNL